MKNKNTLLSKLGKLALIPALAFSLSTKNAESQNVNLSFKLEYDLSMNYSANRPQPYEKWETHFLNPQKSMSLTKRIYTPQLDFNLGSDLSFKIGKGAVGVSLDVPAYSMFVKRSLAKLKLHGWKSEPVTLSEYKLKQTTPSFGGFLRFPIDSESDLVLRGSFQYYNLCQENRQDKMFKHQGAKCDEPVDYTKEYTEVFERTCPEKLRTIKIGLELFKKDSDNEAYRIYYESDFKNFHRVGIAAGFNSRMD
jgi:hypothetical protein